MTASRFRPEIEIGGRRGRAGAARLRDRRGRREPQPRPRASRRADRRRRRCRRRRGEVPDVLRRGPLLDQDAALPLPRRARPTRPRASCSRDRAAARVAVRARRARARRAGSTFFSTPFDRDAVDELAALGVAAMKIASFELVDLQLIAHAAATGRPLILSTGMATLRRDRGRAAARVEAAAHGQVGLLQCASLYPSPPEHHEPARDGDDARRRSACRSGLSDHTTGIPCRSAPRRSGRDLLEKHFTLDRGWRARTIRSRSSRTSCARWSPASATWRPRSATAGWRAPRRPRPRRCTARRAGRRRGATSRRAR